MSSLTSEYYYRILLLRYLVQIRKEILDREGVTTPREPKFVPAQRNSACPQHPLRLRASGVRSGLS